MSQNSSESKTPETKEMGLLEHLSELRLRLIVCAAAIGVLAVAAYFFSPAVFKILCQPYFEAFPDNVLIGTGPAEAFLLKLKVAAFCGLILASPVIFHQAWLFVAPGLYESERRWVMPFVVGATALFIGGVAFCFLAVIPLAFSFFHQQYASIGITPTIRLTEYLSTVLSVLLCFGLVFETPLIAFVLGRLGLIDEGFLLRGLRYAVVAIFIVSAVLTPPDVLTQFLMAGPLILLYGLSIVLVKYTCRRKSPPAG